MNKTNSINTTPPTLRGALVLAIACMGTSLAAQTMLPDFAVVSSRVANRTPAGTFDMPVSALRFEPRADVQARNLAEAQADIAIRGGVFESTGFRIGALTLGDPQTGHYFAELPVPPVMLSAPEVLTGLRNALWSANAGAGTIAYGWRPIRTEGRLELAFGGKGFNRQSLHQGAARELDSGRGTLAAEVEFARSESDGTVPFGDHDFRRAAARVQWSRGDAQTDAFVGYQTKFFGWPNLYTPFGFNETEDLETLLAVLNHAWRDAAGNAFNAALFYRRNRDDYEFNRAVPGASNPFEHTTWMRGAAVSGRHGFPEVALNYAAQVTGDEIRSTALTFGRFSRRTQSKLSAVLETGIDHEQGRLGFSGGVSLDHSDRDGSAWSPLAGLVWKESSGNEWYAELSTARQLPTYTALNSNPAAGLFRGNPNLGRTTLRNYEVGYRGAVQGWAIAAAAFLRQERDLVDWTFRRGVVARTANPVDVDVRGLELVAAWRSTRAEVVLGYAWLEKDSDYGSAAVDASFYALNFPRHRATLAATLHLGAGFALRLDNEYRKQEPNFLRTRGGEEAWLTSAGLSYAPPTAKAWEISLLVENVWDSAFQEVPAVPAAGRQWALGVSRRW
jgi:vitamin B12 transporter